MNRYQLIPALLAASALSAPALARQAAAQAPAEKPDAFAAAAEHADTDAARLQMLTEQVAALQEQLDQLKAEMIKTTPAWKGAPQFEDKGAGFTFKPKGTIQADAGYVGYPDGDRVAGAFYNNLGFSTRFRRAIIGAEGTLPGGFGYNAEFNFAQGKVDYEDIILTYQRKGSPLKVTIGNFYPFSSLETVTSSKFTSMIERASFTDAFAFNRRLGVAVQLLDPKTDRFTLSAGAFNQPVNDDGFTRTGWELAARGTFSPTFGGAKLHFGASAHHRVNPRDGQNEQLRSRPLVQTSDSRFIDTGKIAADGDDVVGVEFGAVLKAFHVAAEAQKLWLDGYRPGATFGANNGTGGGALLNGDPSFWGGYFEAGFFLTGESRGYKGGKWDRTKVRKPFDQGGWGAIQINGRVDYVDLSDDVDGASPSRAAPFFVNGGRQLGLQTSVIWNPTDYLRFLAQYGHLSVKDGPRATVATGSTYGVDTVAARAQIDF